ncbi:MAG TPA: diguanylate cyclase [Polyangia bacterium]
MAKRHQGPIRATTAGSGAQLKAALALLEEVSASPPDAPAIMTVLAARARELTNASGAMIGMREQGDMIIRAAVGSETPFLDQRIALEQSLSGLALTTGQTLICRDTRSELRVNRSRYDGYDMRSLVVVPFQERGANMGVLIVTSPETNFFGGEDEAVLSVLTRVLARRLDQVEELRGYQLLISENEIALATLRESENRFRTAFDHSGIGLALMAIDGRWLKVNPALCRTLGYSRRELLSLDHDATTHPDDRALEAPFLRQILAGGLAHYELEKRYIHKDGSTIWGLLTISAVTNAEGQVLYLIAQIQDITARKTTEQTLRDLAVRDDLTGVWNRREMFRLLNEETLRAERHGRALSLIMLDVDAFKAVNDTYGHQAGDLSLKQIARIIEECVRTFDRVARYGGEEFAVILPETVGADALVVAERIRVRVAAAEFAIGQKDGVDVRIPLTVSSGVATMNVAHDMSVEDMIREADASLYVAKHGGRNQCVAAPSALREPSCPREERAEQSDTLPV